MATIRKHFGKWQVMIRRKGYPHVSKTFTEKSLASTWAKQTELDMERQTYNDVTLASRTTLREVLLKYRDEGITHLKSARTITSKINIILKDKIADYGLTQLRSKHAWEFKKRISEGRKPKTINMYIDTLNSVWKYARTNLSIAVPAEAPASLVAGLSSCLIGFFLSTKIMISPHDIFLGFLAGCFQVGFGFIFITIGARTTPSAMVGIIMLSESVLGPFWAFIFISETPSLFALIGGSTILIAVLLQFYSLLNKRNKNISI